MPKNTPYDDDYNSLKDWPHALTAIEDTLDRDLIAGRGEQLLFRALSTNTLVAFIGSGVSAAYGRMSWSQLKSKQIDDVTNVAEKINQLAHASLRWIDHLLALTCNEDTSLNEDEQRILTNHLVIKRDEIEYQRSEIDNLKTTFDSLRQSKQALGGDIYPIQFQIAKRLMDALQRTETLFVKRKSTLDRRRGEPLLLAQAEKFRKQCKYGYVADDGEKYLLRSHLKKALTGHRRDEIKAYIQFKKAFRAYYRAICRRGANLRFKDHTKYLLYDECAHAEYILYTGLSYTAAAGRTRWRLAHREKTEDRTLADVWGDIENRFPTLDPGRQSRDIKGIADSPDYFDVLGFFKKDPVNNLCAQIREDSRTRSEPIAWANILTLIETAATEGQTPANSRTIWTPTRRFIVSMLLARMDNPLQHNDFVQRFHRPVKSTDFRARYSLIHEEMDPLVHLSLDLSVKHFLTTNYDLEIERLFADRGYEIVKSTRDAGNDEKRGRDDLLGGRSIDAAFERKNTADLVSFSLNLEGADNSVFHLHGRATHDSEIVLTERDYMDLYLRNDEYRDSIDESIDLAFSANPVLFVGLGMNEDDVLRPMRQFVSDQERRWDRTAIALMPAIKSSAARRTEASTLYTRYGALTIYYGDANVGEQHFEWLMIINALCNALGKYNERINQALCEIRRYHDQRSRRVEQLQQAHDDPYQFQEHFTDSCEFIYRHLVQHAPDRRGKIARRRNEWLQRHCPQLLDAVNSNEGYKQEYRKDLHRFVSAFDFASFLPLIEPQAIGADAEHKPDIQFELGLLDNLRDIVLATRLDTRAFTDSPSRLSAEDQLDLLDRFDIAAINSLIRDCRAVQIGIEGCLASIHTAILSSFLRQLKHRQKKWLDDWQYHPKTREPQFEIKPYRYRRCEACDCKFNPDTGANASCQRATDMLARAANLPVRYIRHHIENTFTQLDDNWRAGNSYQRAANNAPGHEPVYTGVRAYDTFVDSLSHARRDDELAESAEFRRQRRTFLVAAHRGLGKGVFLSALASGTGIESFIRASWHQPAGDPRLPVSYRSAIFINYSFSSEIASTWDMLIDALLQTLAETHLQQQHQISSIKRQELVPRVYHGYHLSDRDTYTTEPDDYPNFRIRIGRLRRNLEQLTRAQKLRYLLEQWKQLQVETPQRILICMNALDLMFTENGLPKNAEIAEVLDALICDEFANCPIDLIFIGEEANLPRFLKNDLNTDDIDTQSDLHGVDYNSLHSVITRRDISVYGLRQVEQRLRDCGLTATYFKPGGEHIAGTLPNTIDTSGRYLYFCRVMQPEIFLIDNFEILASILYLGHLISEGSLLATGDIEELNNEYAEVFRKGQKSLHLGNRREHLARLAKMLQRYVIKLGKPTLSATDLERLDSAEPLQKAILRYRYDPPDASAIDDPLAQQIFDQTSYDAWRKIRSKLRHNRFSFTILLAAAEQLAVEQPGLLEAKRRAEAFIESVEANVGTASEERREEVVVHDVLDLYEHFHRAGDPVRDIDLHFTILRHLAVMGQPCSPDVLVRVPEIVQYFDRNSANRRSSREQFDQTFPQRRTGELKQALDQLERCGLVFKLTAHPLLSRLDEHRQSAEGEKFYKKGDTPTSDLHRYSLHRLIHRHVVRKMGGSLKEFVSTNSFAATLYASMPSELPRPTPATYRFLRQLVSSLSGYPDRYMLGDPSEPWHFKTAQPHTRVQALRSALGILRSTFSVAVVSRFEEYKSVGDKWLQRAGYFEEHRVQVRWLIKQASMLDGTLCEARPGITDPDSQRTVEMGELNAFYRDEIIWLYNECGVICLVQGNLLDAVGLFRHAILRNREIEGFGEAGAQHCRISLNLAVVQIERGRLSAAINRLDPILTHREPGTDLHAMATGYRALIHHLQGESDLAQKGYQEALTVLRTQRDSRAASIFCRHFGDLYRLLKKPELSAQLLDEATALAESGGHEDLHKKAQLSRIRFEIVQDKHGSVREHLHHLRQIESYAETMDMPTLFCEATHIHAELLLNQGETTLAGKLLQKVIATAKRNGMELRVTSALTLYGRVMLSRNQPETGRKLLLTALDMTKRLGIQVEIDRIERSLVSFQSNSFY